MRHYSTPEVSELTGLPQARIRRWAKTGLIGQREGDRGPWRYTFQDVAVLRAAANLRDASVPTARVTRTLRKLKEQLPPDRPLSSVQVTVQGRNVVVKDRLASWEPETGQGTLDFDAPTPPKSITPRLPKQRSDAAAADAEELYQAALELELAGQSDAARVAYESVLQSDPHLVAARINLGRLLHGAGKLSEAEALYREALQRDPDNTIAGFNLGVVLEDQGKSDAAVLAYRSVLGVDEAYADAHYNLSRLLEAKGDVRGALRHLSQFRRLAQDD